MEREKRREKAVGVDIYPLLFLYCKRQGALKVNPAGRAEASCYRQPMGVRIPRSMYKRKLHSKFRALPPSENCSSSPPPPSPFSSLALLRAIARFLQRYRPTHLPIYFPFRTVLSISLFLATPSVRNEVGGEGEKVHRSYIWDPRSHFPQTRVPRSLESQGCYNFSVPGYERNIKMHLSPR